MFTFSCYSPHPREGESKVINFAFRRQHSHFSWSISDIIAKMQAIESLKNLILTWIFSYCTSCTFQNFETGKITPTFFYLKTCSNPYWGLLTIELYWPNSSRVVGSSKGDADLAKTFCSAAISAQESPLFLIIVQLYTGSEVRTCLCSFSSLSNLILFGNTGKVGFAIELKLWQFLSTLGMSKYWQGIFLAIFFSVLANFYNSKFLSPVQ